MINYNLVSTPVATGTKLSKEDKGSSVDLTMFKRLVGSLMYMAAMRSDIMYGVSLISRFMKSPQNSYWKVGKRILRYIAGKMGYGILYSKAKIFGLIGYNDSDFIGRTDDRKSTSGYIFHLGLGVVLWELKKQPIVMISSTEA